MKVCIEVTILPYLLTLQSLSIQYHKVSKSMDTTTVSHLAIYSLVSAC